MPSSLPLPNIREIAVPGRFYLPADQSVMPGWPVIACDQYTSDPHYWEAVETRTAAIPSAYHITLPEIYLESPGNVSVDERIGRINRTMKSYLETSVLQNLEECMILTQRTVRSGRVRTGLVLCIDLESYDFTPGNDCPIRATEETVIERIPPRRRIRENALLETSHVMLLVCDPDRGIIEPLGEQARKGMLKPIYDLNLPEKGGRLKGYIVPKNSSAANGVYQALSEIPTLSRDRLAFAVGDGNHSLATAKAHWDRIKSGVSKSHPARYAMVELVNIFDEALDFEPIHRVLYHVSLDDFIRSAPDLMPEAKLSISEKMSVENAVVMAQTIDPGVFPVPVFQSTRAVVFTFPSFGGFLAAGAVQSLIDAYAAQNSVCRVDYIHGEDVLRQLSGQHIGIRLPAIDKEGFFKTVSEGVILPRKAFSMGQADEKRFYMECRRIR